MKLVLIHHYFVKISFLSILTCFKNSKLRHKKTSKDEKEKVGPILKEDIFDTKRKQFDQKN